MIVTEEKAKTKRCQEGFGQPLYDSRATVTTDSIVAFALGVIHGGGYAALGSPSHCIGSACMAWEWLDDTVYKDVPRANDALGYCGKARNR